MRKEAHVHDVIVVGAGASGALAAALLARAEHDVLLLDANRFPVQATCTDWLSPHAEDILKSAAVPTEAILGDPVRHCSMYLADFSKSIDPELPEKTAFLVDYSQLTQAIVRQFQAGSQGRFEDQTDVVEIRLGEDKITALLADGRQYLGKFLLLATGVDSRLVQQTGLSAGLAEGEGWWASAYSCPSGTLAAPGRMDCVLAVGGAGGVGYRMSRDGRLTVGVCVEGSASDAQRELESLSDRFQQRGLLPSDWAEHARGVTPSRSAAGAALAMDSHVAKRTLLIGHAGGFAASYTNEGIYPGMWSAALASQVLIEALHSSIPQDTLRRFESLWRTELAGHLRAPFTDSQSILPLVFSNKQMAGKMVEAFHLGVNF